MKLRFDPNLDYQRDAIRAVVDVFDGQGVEGGGMGFEIEKSVEDVELGFSDLGVW